MIRQWFSLLWVMVFFICLLVCFVLGFKGGMAFVFNLGRVVNEALGVELVELQNSENLAYAIILGF